MSVEAMKAPENFFQEEVNNLHVLLDVGLHALKPLSK
jgi:hypothetical protein